MDSLNAEMCLSIDERMEEIENSRQDKQDYVDQLEGDLLNLCSIANQSNSGLYLQKERFKHYKQEYEEAWSLYEAALQLCEIQGVSPSDINNIISSILPAPTSPQPPLPSTPLSKTSTVPFSPPSPTLPSSSPPSPSPSSSLPSSCSTPSPSLPQNRPPVPPRPSTTFSYSPSPPHPPHSPSPSRRPRSPSSPFISSSPSPSPSLSPSPSPSLDPSASPISPSLSPAPSPSSPAPSSPSHSPLSPSSSNPSPSPSSPPPSSLPPSSKSQPLYSQTPQTHPQLFLSTPHSSSITPSSPSSFPPPSPGSQILFRSSSKKRNKKLKGAGVGGGRGGEMVQRIGWEVEWEEKMRHACELFNQKPKKCFEYLTENHFIPCILSKKEGKGGKEGDKEGEKEGGGEGELEKLRVLHSASVGSFLLGFGEHLDEVLLGDYLSDRCDTVYNIQSIREDYFNLIGLRDMEISAAMRKILTYFRLPGEAQKIERILESFAKVYFQQQTSTGALKNSDTVLVLAYSLTMLNTDAHNPQVKKKMKKDEFVKNNRGINDGEDLPADLLGSLYDDIVNNEIKTNCSQIYPRAAKRGSLLIKANSWVRYAKRWAIINEGTLHIFKSESDTESILDIPLKGIIISLDTKRKKITFFSKDLLHSSSGNFPIKIDIDHEKDFQEWSSLINSEAKKEKEFLSSPSSRSLFSRPQRSFTEKGGLVAWRGRRSSEDASEDIVSNEECYSYDMSER